MSRSSHAVCPLHCCCCVLASAQSPFHVNVGILCVVLMEQMQQQKQQQLVQGQATEPLLARAPAAAKCASV
jgi:hypothetical protein